MLIPFKELFARYQVRTRGILHLGANIGQEAKAYADLGVRRVFWVEALEDMYQKLLQTIEPYPENIAFHACLSDKDRDLVTFNRASNGSQSSSYLELGTHAKDYPDTVYIEEIQMYTVRVDTLLKDMFDGETGRWFLNVDLQGAELKAIKGMGNLLWHFDYAYVEVNDREVYKGCPLVGEVDEFLWRYGFVPKETKMMKEGWGDRFYERTRYADHQHK